MAHRHLMAVCVMCLLCAEHFPCKLHVLAALDTGIISNDLQKTKEFSGDFPYEKDFSLNYFYDKRKDKLKSPSLKHRQKRHAHHEQNNQHNHHHIHHERVTENYVQKIFNDYSTDATSMSLDGFQKFTSKLNLNKLFSKEKDTCMNHEKFLAKITHYEENEEDFDHGHEQHESELEISTDNFVSICPILLYYATNQNSSCLELSDLTNTEIPDELTGVEQDRGKVWLYSTFAIFLVSLCGLLGIAVIPIMDKHIYTHAVQFLVALAVGTLAGDALLHLMPHAMLQLHEDQDMHKTMMYRGLAAMGAIVFFYFFERCLVMITEWKQKREKRDKPSSRVRVMRDLDTASLNGSATTCKHKYSTYPYCYDEIAMETKDDHHEHQHINSDEATALNNHRDLITVQNELIGSKKMNGDISNDLDNNTLTLSTSLDDGSIESNALCNNNKLQSGNPVSIVHAKSNEMHEENYTIILRWSI